MAKKKLKKFTVTISETIGGYASVKAMTLEEAEETAEDILNDDGIKGFKDFKITNREVDLIDTIES